MSEATQPPLTANQMAEQRTSLGIERTVLAYERTMMAWVRTATALISFGFSVYKFFQAMGERGTLAESRHLVGPREFALAMIGMGVGALVVALIENRRAMTSLRSRFGQQAEIPRSLASGVGAVLACLGILGFALVLLRQ